MTDDLVNNAVSLGFTHAAWLMNLELECEARLRAYCNPEGCPNHGQNWVCPPGCGTLEDCAGKVGRFKNGLLLQSVTELKPPVETDVYKALNRRHNFILRKFIEKICGRDNDILALTSGGCVFCDTCSYPSPCIKPDIRMNSLSAYGIDVGAAAS